MELFILIIGGYFIYRHVTKKNQQKQQLFEILNKPSENAIQNTVHQEQAAHDDGNCKGCGAILAPDAVMCEYCRLKVFRPNPKEQPHLHPQPTMNQNPQPQWHQPPKKNPFFGCLKGCGCFVLIIIAITFAITILTAAFGTDLIWILENL